MFRSFLRAKIHGARVTGAVLHYEGSVAIGRRFLEALDLQPGERVDVYNVANGARFSTYVIDEGAGETGIVLNGAAARLVQAGDSVIIAAYALVDLSVEPPPKPVIALVQGDDNRFKLKDFPEPVRSKL